MGEYIIRHWKRTTPLARGAALAALLLLSAGLAYFALGVDTDQDGWDDSVDSNTVSRAWLDWGEPSCISDDYHNYPRPDWVLSAYKIDGEWQTNSPTSWYVSPTNAENVGSLNLDVDRSILTNNAVLEVCLFDTTNGTFYVDLCDSNDVVVATNLFGNLIESNNTSVVVVMDIPFPSYPAAASIYMRRGTGEITVYDSLLYIDEDGDGLDADQELQLGTSDYDTDSDDDWLDDYEESFSYGTDPTDPDSDNDGINDGNEVAYGQNPTSYFAYSTLTFTELFETNTCSAGNLNGQNGWASSPANKALVQTTVKHAGSQALRFDGDTNTTVYAQHLFADSGESVVWGDLYVRVVGASAPTGAVSGSAAFFFNTNGYLNVYNTSQWQTLSHPAVTTGTWARVTAKLDYSAHQWLIVLDGTNCVASELGFAEATTEFVAFSVEAQDGYLDDFGVSTNVPSGIDSDEDGLWDSWEMQEFGDLDETASGDPDSDGLNNLGEYNNSTDPNDADSDDDGLNDGPEVNTYGSDPLDTDSDNDGVSDGNEVDYGYSPTSSNAYTSLPFTELFETNTCAAGLINGQNGWVSSPTNKGVVQTGTVYASSSQALQLDGDSNTTVTVRHLFADSGQDIVWADMYALATPAAAPTGAVTGSAAFYLNTNAQLVVYNTDQWVTITNHAAITTGTWIRLTVKLDYTASLWDLALNATDVATDLGFAGQTTEFAAFTVAGKNGYLDNFTTATTSPWETDADSDGDILTDYDEVNVVDLDPNDADSDDDSTNDAYLVLQQDGVDRTSDGGSWEWLEDGTELINPTAGPYGNHAWAQYTMSISNPGVYLFAMELRSATNGLIPDDWKFQINTYVNDYSFSNNYVEILGTFTGTLGYVITPYLQIRDHNLKLEWLNDAWDPPTNVDIVVTTVRLYGVDGPDTNANGYQDWVESYLLTMGDTDGDGLTDYDEVLIHGTSPVHEDTDGDGKSDGWEIDNNDDPLDMLDTDQDGIVDWWENTNGLNWLDPADAAEDPDSDHLANLGEYQNSTDPHDPDCDDDGLMDGCEVDLTGTDPLDTDTDNDTLSEWWESRHDLGATVSNSVSADPDNDGLDNETEEALLTDPLGTDSDGDGLSDSWENTYSNYVSLNSALTQSLVSWWRFDEASGMMAHDDNEIWENNGQLANGTAREPSGHAGRALALDGSDDYVTIADHYSLCSTNGLTLMLWANIAAHDDTNNPVYFISKGNAAGQAEYNFSYLDSTGSLQFSHKNPSSQSETVSVSVDLPTNEWTHLAVTVSGTNVCFYTNGVQAGTTQHLTYQRSNLGGITIGSTAATSATNPEVHGLLDEVRVYNVALSASAFDNVLDAEDDTDSDGLTNLQEYTFGLSPATDDETTDSDGDGLYNKEEVLTYGTDPFSDDSDGDGLNDGDEIDASTDPLVADQGSDPDGPALTVTYPKDRETLMR